MTHTRLEELAQRLAARTQELRGERTPAPALRVVAGDAHVVRGERRMDAIMREWHCRMIRNVRRRWGEPMQHVIDQACCCLLYTSPSPRDRTRSRMPSSA